MTVTRRLRRRRPAAEAAATRSARRGDDAEPGDGASQASGVRQPAAVARPIVDARVHRARRSLRRPRPTPPPRPPPRRAPRRSPSRPPRARPRRASAAAAASASASAASSAASSSSGGSSPPSGTTSVFTSTCTSWKSSIGIEKRPIRLSGSIAILRRSTRTLRARQISSAMSDGVTEPKSEPVGPAFTSKRSTVLPRSSAISCACSAVRASCFARSASTRRTSATRAGVAFSARRRGRRIVARVPACDVDDLAAEAELLDVLEEDDLHQPTYGRRAISRARFTAAATWIWWRRQAPVIRRERIFPFSEM